MNGPHIENTYRDPCKEDNRIITNVLTVDVGNSSNVNYRKPKNIDELKLILLRIESKPFNIFKYSGNCLQ